MNNRTGSLDLYIVHVGSASINQSIYRSIDGDHQQLYPSIEEPLPLLVCWSLLKCGRIQLVALGSALHAA